VTAAVGKDADGQRAVASGRISGCVDADGNSGLGDFLVYRESLRGSAGRAGRSGKRELWARL
jgi:hypothetical protein